MDLPPDWRRLRSAPLSLARRRGKGGARRWASGSRGLAPEAGERRRVSRRITWEWGQGQNASDLPPARPSPPVTCSDLVANAIDGARSKSEQVTDAVYGAKSKSDLPPSATRRTPEQLRLARGCERARTDQVGPTRSQERRRLRDGPIISQARAMASADDPIVSQTRTTASGDDPIVSQARTTASADDPERISRAAREDLAARRPHPHAPRHFSPAPLSLSGEGPSVFPNEIAPLQDIPRPSPATGEGTADSAAPHGVGCP